MDYNYENLRVRTVSVELEEHRVGENPPERDKCAPNLSDIRPVPKKFVFLICRNEPTSTAKSLS